jgi:hypothetical protein
MQGSSSGTPGPAPDVSLAEAGPHDIPVLRRLMQLHLYDLGSLDGCDIGRDGLFGNAERIERYTGGALDDGERTAEDGRRRVQHVTAPGAGARP